MNAHENDEPYTNIARRSRRSESPTDMEKKTSQGNILEQLVSLEMSLESLDGFTQELYDQLETILSPFDNVENKDYGAVPAQSHLSMRLAGLQRHVTIIHERLRELSLRVEL